MPPSSIIPVSDQNKNYKWAILTLVVLTNMLVVAIPSMSMSVLSKEISQDLGLNLVQVGIVWGIGSLPGVITSLMAGAIGDKLGPKRVLLVGSLATALLGAARGLVPDFLSMVVVVLLLGAMFPFVTLNGFKTVGQWFPPSQLGLANGLISMSMALGFFLGSLFSATLLSPLLDGWRNVLIVYGLAGVLISIPWFFTRSLPTSHQLAGQTLSISKTIRHVSGLKNIWLLGLALFGVGGCIQGLLGYLPLYLRSVGWDTGLASGALSVFHITSMAFVLPIALWSDRLGSRKRLLILAAAFVVCGTGLLSFASGGWVWAAVLMAGFVRDAFMAIFLTMVVETRGVGPTYAGTAVGITMTISSLGTLLAPPLGNSLAIFWPGAPFAFWALCAVFGLICLFFVKSENRPVQPVVLENIL